MSDDVHVPHRRLITASAMLSMFMQVLLMLLVLVGLAVLWTCAGGGC